MKPETIERDLDESAPGDDSCEESQEGRGASLEDLAGYDVLIVGGGPAGLSAGAMCGRKMLRTAVFEADCWGGILTCHCPDKRIDNYPGARRGILAQELADILIDGAVTAGVDMIGQAVDEITPEREVRAGQIRARAKIVILASGSTSAEASIAGEKELYDRRAGVHYKVPDPSDFRGLRVVVIGGGDTAVSHVQRLCAFAESVTLVHRHVALRAEGGLPEEIEAAGNVDIVLGTAVASVHGNARVEGVVLKEVLGGRSWKLPADAVIMAVGRTPNTALFRDLHLEMDAKGQIMTDEVQRTNVPGFLAVGDVSSPLKLIITAVAQATTAAHEAYAEVISPYWK